MVWKKNRHCPDPSHSRVRANGVSYFPYSIPKIEDILQDELFSPWGYLLIYLSTAFFMFGACLLITLSGRITLMEVPSKTKRVTL
ncbi:hypothetical protein [Sphingobacterium suaedae]|uniref:Uncharacterized protein n=1 Tax=Sphingobacterium suaedae TaxID=1686402 RepID=A0ABW5KFN4_9SPHI